MLSDSREKAKMKLTLERNKPGNAGRLRRIRNTVLLGGLGILIPCTVVFAQAPDNSKTNQQDRGSATADQQAENQGDRDLARKIHKAIMDYKSLSTYAHNVKEIARSGTATLKGTVHNDDKQMAIKNKAAARTGATNDKH